MPLYEYYCEHCGKFFEAFRPVNLRNSTNCSCGSRAKKLISLPSTEKDKAYEFYSENFGPQKVWVRSKTHYNKLRKQNRIIDANFKESFQEAAIKRKSKDVSMAIKRRKRAEKIATRIHQDGLTQEAPGMMKKLLKI